MLRRTIHTDMHTTHLMFEIGGDMEAVVHWTSMYDGVKVK